MIKIQKQYSDQRATATLPMDPNSPKPYSRFIPSVSSPSWLLPASILKYFRQSSITKEQNHPKTDEPDSSISVYNYENQVDSQDHLHEVDLERENPNTPHPKLEVEESPFPQADMETQDELGVTNSIPSYPLLPLSILERLDSKGDESAPPCPTPSIENPMSFYNQMQIAAPMDLEHLLAENSPSSSFDSFSTESSSRDRINITPPQPSTIATEQSPNGPKISTKVEELQSNEVRVLIPNTEEQKEDTPHPVLEIIDEQELGRNVLVLAIPMVMGLVVSSSPFAKSPEMKVVAVELCCAFLAIWNGILLRKSHRTASTLLLVGGIALMMLAFYSFMGCFLPLELKWIPGLCWVGSLFRLAKVLLAFFGRKKVAGEDLEKGKD